MGYTIATVTDDTDPNLEYGDYRGLVLLDERGRYEVNLSSVEEGVGAYAAIYGVDAERVQIKPVHYLDYGPCWDLNH